ELNDRNLRRVTDVEYLAGYADIAGDQQQRAYEVIDIAEGARLQAIAVHAERIASQRRGDELGHGASVLRVHARAICVEDSHDAGIDAALAPKRHCQRLAKALGLVVARPRSDRVEI